MSVISQKAPLWLGEGKCSDTLIPGSLTAEQWMWGCVLYVCVCWDESMKVCQGQLDIVMEKALTVKVHTYKVFSKPTDIQCSQNVGHTKKYHETKDTAKQTFCHHLLNVSWNLYGLFLRNLLGKSQVNGVMTNRTP